MTEHPDDADNVINQPLIERQRKEQKIDRFLRLTFGFRYEEPNGATEHAWNLAIDLLVWELKKLSEDEIDPLLTDAEKAENQRRSQVIDALNRNGPMLAAKDIAEAAGKIGKKGAAERSLDPLMPQMRALAREQPTLNQKAALTKLAAANPAAWRNVKPNTFGKRWRAEVKTVSVDK